MAASHSVRWSRACARLAVSLAAGARPSGGKSHLLLLVQPQAKSPNLLLPRFYICKLKGNTVPTLHELLRG